jgi:chemotaxis protein methyltransferase CheR
VSEVVLDDATLGRVEEVLRAACGLTLAHSLRRSLETALNRAARGQGLEPDAFLRMLLLREPAAVEGFIEHAVIGETYFFRHPEHLRTLARVALPHPGPVFQVWSAGCASGEEPYSIAMALLAAGMAESRFRVLATDVSTRALQRAKEGIYGPWSLRRFEPELEKTFLVPRGEELSVSPQVRRMVDFKRHNLAVDAPPTMGVSAIFCRNVLIYFPQELVHTVLEQFISALVPGGLLFVSPAEVPLTNGLGLETVDAEGSVVMRVPATGWTRPSPQAPPPPPPTYTPARVERPRPPPAPLRRRPTPAPAPAVQAREPAAPAPAPVARVAASASGAETLGRALEAARAGRFEEAEALAREAARGLIPEAYLLLAMVAEGRGDLNGAVEAVRKALYLEPQLAIGHATLVALYGRMDRREDAERARQNALRALEGLDDEHPVRGVETTMTAGGLRQALAPRTPAGWQGAR